MNPTPTKHGNEPESQPNPTKDKPREDVRGTKAPIIIRVQPTCKTQEEAANEKAQRDKESTSNWRMLVGNATLAIIAFLQLIAFGQQARRSKQTIHKMDKIAKDQTGDRSPDDVALIRSNIRLWRGTGLSLNGSVFDDQHTLRLLAVDDDRLIDTFLRERGRRANQNTDD
jgi:hypothetical protein